MTEEQKFCCACIEPYDAKLSWCPNCGSGESFDVVDLIDGKLEEKSR